MRRGRRRLARAALLVVLLAACSTRAQGPGQFRQDVGVGSAPDVITIARRILALHRFEVYQEHLPPDATTIYIETHWLERRPFVDEQSLGVEAAQSRAIVSGRPRSVTSAQGTAWSVSLVVENRVRITGTDGWSNQTVSTDARQYADGIAQQLRRELTLGVRRH
jgi:hypothetical protein